MKVISFTHRQFLNDIDQCIWICYDGIKKFAPELAPIVAGLETFDVRVSTQKFHGYDVAMYGWELQGEMSSSEFCKFLFLLGIIDEYERWARTFFSTGLEIFELIGDKTFYFQLVDKMPTL